MNAKEEFLVKKIIEQQAMLETILKLLVEMSLKGKDELISKRFNELMKVAEDKAELTLRNL